MAGEGQPSPTGKVIMLITTDKPLIREPNSYGAGLVEIKADNDKFIFLHAQDVTPILVKAHDIRKHSDNGWTEDRNFRQIGAIPEIEFLKHPEWMHEPDLIAKWLNSDEGRGFRTVNNRV